MFPSAQKRFSCVFTSDRGIRISRLGIHLQRRSEKSLFEIFARRLLEDIAITGELGERRSITAEILISMKDSEGSMPRCFSRLARPCI